MAAYILIALLTLTLITSPFAKGGTEEIIEVKKSETLFTMFSFVTLNKYTDSDSSKLNPVQKYVFDYLKQNLSVEYAAELKQEFDKYNNHMFEYWLTMLAVNCSEPSQIKSLIDETELYNKNHGINTNLSEIKKLEPLIDVFNKFYEEAAIDELFSRCSIWYDSAAAVYKLGTESEINKVLAFLRMDSSFYDTMDKIVIVPNLIGPRGTAMGPVYRGIKYDIESPYEKYLNEISLTPHEYIHDMIKHLTKSEEYKVKITEAVDKIWGSIENTNAKKYYNDKVLFFDECLVRSIDYYTSINDKEKLAKTLEKHQQPAGFVLVIPMAALLERYESADYSFSQYFEEFLKLLNSAPIHKSQI